MNYRVLVIGVPLAILSIVAGCASSDPTSDTAAGGNSVAGDAPAVDFNDADVMFAQMMIPHHEQAIEMSDIALDPQIEASEAVRALAQRIKDAQDPEIDQMTALLSAWGESTAMDSDADHSSMMSGMLSLEDLADLSRLLGADFDRAWIEAMIAHHEGAIQMAQDVLDSGANVDMRSLAEKIISGQQAEIDEMRALLG